MLPRRSMNTEKNKNRQLVRYITRIKYDLTD